MKNLTERCSTARVGWWQVFLGVLIFFGAQYFLSLYRLLSTTSSMDNKFSALAREKYWLFLLERNVLVLLAYALVVLLGAWLIQPLVSLWAKKSERIKTLIMSVILAALAHGFFIVRLVQTRPYFLNKEELKAWYYAWLNWIPQNWLSEVQTGIFVYLPIIWLLYATWWHLSRRGWLVRVLAVFAIIALGSWFLKKQLPKVAAQRPKKVERLPYNILIIGSDSLRGDKLGCAGYQPAFKNGPAAQSGVSPAIDRLAKASTRFENTYTGIASTMESGTSLMSSMLPQSHGIRHMFPNQATVEAANQKIVPAARIFKHAGYDTAAIGDWCASYYKVLPLDFETISVSSFDNFKIYMSQAVLMSHSIVPLYFDNALGYFLFPDIQAFAQFVTPHVVTERVEKRLQDVAKTQKPFFWHVFYSCNHLTYRCQEPYRSYFGDPNYQGRNRTEVDFDIESFIGKTDLESKWNALSHYEVNQIKALYDGCTRSFDDCVQRILDELKRQHLDQHTIVVVTADHGDDHYEPNVTLGHGLTLNGGSQSYHVPLIVYVPGQVPKVIRENVRLIDLIPTLTELAELKAPREWQGKSVASWIKEESKPITRPVYMETGFPFIQFSVPGIKRPALPAMDELNHIDESFNYQFVLKPEYEVPLVKAKQRCIRTQNWQLVCTPTESGGRHFQLFKLSSDPNGSKNVFSEFPNVATPMKKALETWIDENKEFAIEEIFPQGEPS